MTAHAVYDLLEKAIAGDLLEPPETDVRCRATRGALDGERGPAGGAGLADRQSKEGAYFKDSVHGTMLPPEQDENN
jgi:hypothetical protein